MGAVASRKPQSEAPIMHVGPQRGERSFCFATGLELGRRALGALCAAGFIPRLAIGYDPSLQHRSGYVSLRSLADRYAFDLIEVRDINAPSVFERVQAAAPDLLIVAGWSQLVRDPLLSSFPLEAVGMHPTALPQGRGRAPIPWTLIKGLDKTAVTLFYLVEEADAGDIVDQQPIAVSVRDDATSLYAKVAEAHAAILVRAVPRLLAGEAGRQPQGEGDFWPKRRPEDGVMDWSSDVEDLYDWVRALTHPYPGAFTFAGGRRLVVWSADMLRLPTDAAAPGQVVGPVWSSTVGGAAIACRGGLLILRTVELDGAGEVDGLSLLESQVLVEGDLLG
jgi:methionyl-tRNA formyltransferase